MQYFGGNYLGGNFFGGPHSPTPIVIGGVISVIVISTDYVINNQLSSIGISYDIDTDKEFQPEYQVIQEVVVASFQSGISFQSPATSSELTTTFQQPVVVKGFIGSTISQPRTISELSIQSSTVKASLGSVITAPSIQSTKAEFGVTKQVATGSMQSQILDPANSELDYSVEEI